MRRRAFLNLLGAIVAWPPLVRAQQLRKIYRIGWLTSGSSSQQLHLIKAFEESLRNLGYRIGENVIIEYRFADGEAARLPALIADLSQRGVDVIITGNHSAAAVIKGASNIPIVVPNSVDPVSNGLVASLARPGGNVTGLTQDTGAELNGKRLELLKEIFPSIKRVGVLFNPEFAPNSVRLPSVGEAARTLGLTHISAKVPAATTLEEAFSMLVEQQAEGLIVLGDSVLFNARNQIGAMAIANRLPAISVGREYAEAGLLLAYGVDFYDLFRRSALFVDKILKGVAPADLPVEQPAKFELVVNAKTAKILRLTIPSTLLARADNVIE
ncbi:ABC transporter substrate-binding protein [Bradyrhizobium sp. DOA9]|uniref:ABC transporter substrate-binding protein n=1 Tax=Bradyrhizobium sp. DOA9 TaxID=1126627 RepID=UPI000469AE43|nr:ABC transporter substrate-binding protein [Bradyrhizobium sp. DOA9]